MSSSLRYLISTLVLVLAACGGRSDDSPANSAPAVANATLTVTEDQPGTVSVQATDANNDALSATVTANPAKGIVTVSGTNPFTFSYTPNLNANGADTFSFRVADPSGAAATASVAVTITPQNDAPVAVADVALIAAAGPTDINVLVNDTDIDGDTLTIEVTAPPPGAGASVAGGVVRVTPAAGATGPTNLTYRISDSHGGTASASVRVVIGHASPLFFTAGAASPATKRIYRYNFLSPPVALDTPLPSGDTLDRFTTAANGSWMVYVSRANGPPVRHRLWLKNLDDLSVPVVEIPTDPSFFTNYLRISPDGFIVVFNDRYTATTMHSFVQDIDPGSNIENRTFTRNGQRLFYTVVLGGGGRIIKRADVPLTGVLANRLQITRTYGVAEGLGSSFLLTPDETRILSTGLFVVGAPVNAVKQHSFVTTADGSQDDAMLHAPFVGLLDGAGQALSTPDSNYAFGVSVVNGLSTAASTSFTTPGTHVTIASTINQIDNLRVAGDSQTVFFTIDGILPVNWARGQINQFGSHVAFQPAGGGASAPRVVQPAPDGSAVVFDSGAAIYGVLGGQFVTPSLLYTRGSTATPAIRYAPDSTSVAVANPGETGLVILNPKALGWFEVLGQPNAQPMGATCLAFAGEDC